MCGIYGGVFLNSPKQSDLDNFDTLGKLLRHRGPDDSGEYRAENILLGFRRLSIVDVLKGHQPMSNLDESVILIGNGEIYNYKEIRVKLEKLGHVFRTDSDIECLLHSYLEFGDDFLNEMRGMFAFGILDKRLNRFILGRDRLGEKPLYYANLPDSMWFSSESSALMNCGVKKFSLSRIGICRYLKYGFVTEEYPLIEDIIQVAPGTIVIFDLLNMSSAEIVFWSLEDFREIRSTVESEKYRFELNEIGSKIFQGEVPIGIALSGGIDSSLIASIAKRLEKKVTVISIGYNSDKKFDESRMAASFSETLGFECRIRNISAQEVGKRFTELVQAMDEPIADPSSFNYFVLGEEARKLGLKVLLSGHGPDEFFWGYPWISNLYNSTALRMKMYSTGASITEYLTRPKFEFKTIGALIDDFKIGFGVIAQIQQFFEDSRSKVNRDYSIPVYSRAPSFRQKNRIGRKLDLDLTIGGDSLESIDESEIAHGQEIVREILIKSYLRVNGLSQIDRLWMANSIEGRSVLVDYKLVESALSDLHNIPSVVPLKKARFRDHISEFLSPEKLNQRKQGFTPPVREWYLEIYRQNKTLLSNSKLVDDGLISRKAQRYMRRPLTLIGRPRPLWLELITLEFWYQKNFYPNV